VDTHLLQFVDDLEGMIAASLFDSAGNDEAAKHKKWLHSCLRPFWHEPCVMFLMLGEDFDEPPGAGVICLPGKYRQECTEALGALMKAAVPTQDDPASRRAFTRRKGMCLWTGVAAVEEGHTRQEDPEDRIKAIRERPCVMICDVYPVLCVATHLNGRRHQQGVQLARSPEGQERR